MENMKTSPSIFLTILVSCLILYSCMSQEQQEQVLQNSEPQAVDVTVNVGGDSRAERFLGTFDEISRLSLDIDRNYGNKRVLTDFPLVNDGAKWTGTINKLIVGFDYTVTGHAYKCEHCYSDNASFALIEDLESCEVHGLETLTESQCSEAYEEMMLNPSAYDINGAMNGYNPDHLQSNDPFGCLLLSNNSVRFNGWSDTDENITFDNQNLIGVCKADFLEIFRGDTQHTVKEGNNTLDLRLSPLLDDRELTVPRITRINRPFQMEASTSDNITVKVDTVKKEGSSAEDGILSFRFRSVDNDSLPLDNITGGSFSPASGDVTKSGSSYPDISTLYTAPDNDSTMKLQIRVSNELEIGVTSHFNVYVTDDIETQNTIDTNPVIENISAERLDNGDLKWTMNVSNDDGFVNGAGNLNLKVKWEYLFGDNRTFTNISNTATQGDSKRGVMQATMSGYQDSDDGMLLVTVCEDGDLPEIPDDCAYMNEASTSISMELIPGAYEQPIICDGDSCSVDYEGTWIGCDDPWLNTDHDDFVATRNTVTIGSGKMIWKEEFLSQDNGSCNGDIGMTMKWEGSITDNGTKVFAMDGSDNVSASSFDLTWDKVLLSFSDLNFVNEFKPDNESYLCGESYWTDVERDVTQCKFWNSDFTPERKYISHVRDNNTLKLKSDNTTPSDFWCLVLGLESEGNFLYPECDGSSGNTGVWDQSTWDNSVFGD